MSFMGFMAFISVVGSLPVTPMKTVVTHSNIFEFSSL